MFDPVNINNLFYVCVGCEEADHEHLWIERDPEPLRLRLCWLHAQAPLRNQHQQPQPQVGLPLTVSHCPLVIRDLSLNVLLISLEIQLSPI